MFHLPTMTLVAPASETNSAPVVQKRNNDERMMDPIERKVLVNAGMLISSSDTPKQCLQKLADCLADAVGLFTDFNDLPQ